MLTVIRLEPLVIVTGVKLKAVVCMTDWLCQDFNKGMAIRELLLVL